MRPIVTFYRLLVFPATFFTLFTCFLLVKWGSIYYTLTLFWIKIASTALLGVVNHLSHSEHLYFYHNLGFSTVRLYALAAALDMLIWGLSITVTAQFI